jgi:hypothetical protein
MAQRHTRRCSDEARDRRPVDLRVSALLIYGVIVLGLAVLGLESSFRAHLQRNPLVIFFKSISAGLERATGYPGWAMAGALSGLWALATAALGLYWDVGWHIDLGRDKALFTPPHTLIVIGLAGIIYSAGIAVLFANLDEAPVGVRIMGLRVPYSALPMAALGVGALVGFPLDALWHEAYGIDVTLWSPTHLMLVGGGGLGTIAVWLMLMEGRPAGRATVLGRGIAALSLGAILVGLSCFEGEFDFGVPQFQVIYLPVLIAATAGFTLVLARATLGPWGAVKAVVGFHRARRRRAHRLRSPPPHLPPLPPLPGQRLGGGSSRGLAGHRQSPALRPHLRGGHCHRGHGRRVGLGEAVGLG